MLSGTPANVHTNVTSAPTVTPSPLIPNAYPSSVPVAPSLSSTASVPVTLTYALAPSSPVVMQSAGHRRLQYISSSNALMSITVTPFGGSPTTYGPSACTTTTCTVSFTASPGPTTLAFSLTDSSSNVLSSFSAQEIIQPATLNTLNFTANPVVKSVTLQLANASINAGAPVNDLLTVNAQDAGGNTIIGNAPYIDSNGNPVTLSLNVSNNQDGGKGTVTLQGPSFITAPNHAAVYTHYDGNWLASSTISVSTNSSVVTASSTASITTIPSITQYSQNMTSGASPRTIVAGSDGNLWFTETGANHIGRITTKGVITEFDTSAGTTEDILGSDGNIWFTEYSGGNVGRVTPSGNVQEYSVGGGAPNSITAASDGKIWFSDWGGGEIGNVSTGGVVTPFSAPVFLVGITQGGDGNIWTTAYFCSCIEKTTLSGSTTQYTAGISSGATPLYDITGPDGNVWFTEYGASRIGSITPQGVVTEFSTNITSSSNPNSITIGPDGNMWFTEYSAKKIASITTSGTVTEYTLGGLSGFALQGITLGPDGNLWFVENGGSIIGKFVL